MTTTLTETANFDTPIVVPAEGEVAFAASVIPAIQKLTNRTALHEFDLRTGGISRIQEASAAAFADLKAVAPADRSEGCVRMVANFGVYRFAAISADPESLPWIVAPTTGTGRWYHSSYSMTSDANGLCRKVAGKVDAIIPYGTVGTYNYNSSAGFGIAIATSTSASWVDTVVKTSVAGQVGDILICTATVRHVMSVGAPALSGFVRLAHEQSGITTAFDATQTPAGREGAEDKAVTTTMSFRHEILASAAFAHYVKVQIKSNGSDQISLMNPASLTVTHMRP